MNIMILLVGMILFIALPFGIIMLFCIRKIPPGNAGVRVGIGGYVISDTWFLRIPLVTRYDLMDITV